MIRSKEEVYIYRCTHIDVARYICIYRYVYMCVGVYREREIERDTEIDVLATDSDDEAGMVRSKEEVYPYMDLHIEREI